MATVLERARQPIPVDVPGRLSRRPPLKRGILIVSIVVTALVVFGVIASWLHPKSKSVTNLGHVPGAPTQIVAGVPVGYTHDGSGAIAAATNYDVAIGGKQTLDPNTRGPIIAAIVAKSSQSGYAAMYVENAKNILPALGGSLTGAVFQENPIMYHLDSYAPNHAVVSIWQMSVIASPAMSIPRELWGVDQLVVVWENGDWKLSAGTTLPNGPTMAGDTTHFPTPTAQLLSTLGTFTPYYQIPGQP